MERKVEGRKVQEREICIDRYIWSTLLINKKWLQFSTFNKPACECLCVFYMYAAAIIVSSVQGKNHQSTTTTRFPVGIISIPSHAPPWPHRLEPQTTMTLQNQIRIPQPHLTTYARTHTLHDPMTLKLPSAKTHCVEYENYDSQWCTQTTGFLIFSHYCVEKPIKNNISSIFPPMSLSFIMHLQATLTAPGWKVS